MLLVVWYRYLTVAWPFASKFVWCGSSASDRNHTLHALFGNHLRRSHQHKVVFANLTSLAAPKEHIFGQPDAPKHSSSRAFEINGCVGHGWNSIAPIIPWCVLSVAGFHVLEAVWCQRSSLLRLHPRPYVDDSGVSFEAANLGACPPILTPGTPMRKLSLRLFLALFFC